MKYRLTTILAFLVVFFQVASAQDASIVDAAQKYSEGKFSEARAILGQITAKDPSNDAAWYYDGLCAAYLKDMDRAVSSLEKASSLDKGNYWYRERLAVAYASAGKSSEAVSQYEQLLKDFPKKKDAYYTLVNLYLAAGQNEKAVKAIDEIEKMQGKSDATVMTRYNLLQRSGKNEEAFNVLKEYSDEYASPQVLTMLGDYEMGLYNDSTAVSYYQQALALDKDYAPAMLGKAEAYRITKKYGEYFPVMKELMGSTNIPSEAKCSYLQALFQHMDPRFVQDNKARMDTVIDLTMQVHPKDTAVFQTAGIWYYNTERQDKAGEIFRQNMENNPDNITATIAYLQLLSSQKKWDELVEESEKAFEKFPQETGFLEMASSGEYFRKNYKGVIEKSERIISVCGPTDQRSLGALSNMGDMYHTLGETEKAYKTYEKALKIDPDYAPVLNNYAWYLCLEGRKLKKALAMSKKTVDQEPDNPTYLDTYGWILHLLGRDVEAKAAFKHAMLYGGKESAAVMSHYADVLDALGEKELAGVYRNQAKNTKEEEE